MNTALRGKTDAGNPHVRFGEGEVASAKPRRGSLLDNANIILSCAAVAALGTTCFAAPLSDYTIVTPASLSAADACVLADFNGLLAKSLGSELKVVEEDSAPAANCIYFGIAPAGVKTEKLASQEFVTIVEKGGDIRLFGGRPNGTRYAAYDFLETTLGFRFFDWRGGMRVPDLKAWTPTSAVRRHTMSFETRDMSTHWHFNGPEWGLYLLRHGLNGRTNGILQREKCGAAVDEQNSPHPNNSSLPSYLPRTRKSPHVFGWINEIIGDRDLEKTNPEFFTMGSDGKRHFDSQRCLTNPECRALLKKIVFAQLARQKTPAFVDISAADTPGSFCCCPECRAMEKRYGSLGGPLIDVFIEFCPEVARLYPQHRLMTLVYRKCQTQHPPKNLAKMPDNFVPDFAPIDDDFSKDWTHPNNADTLDDLKTWGRMCKAGILMWYYPNPYGGEITPPFGNVERLVNDVKIMHAAGTRYAGFEHNVGTETMTGFTELQTYLLAHLFRDVNCDCQALQDEFIDFEYGRAARGVKAYLAKLEELRKAMTNRIPWDASRYLGNFPYLTRERIGQWEEAFDVLERVTEGDARAQRNVRRLRLNLDLANYKLFGDKAVLARIRAILKEIGEDCYSDRFKGYHQKLVKNCEDDFWLMEIKNTPGAKPLPSEIFGKIPEQDIFVTLPTSDGGKVKDEDAAYGVAMAFVGRHKPEAFALPFVGNVETINPTVTWQPKIGRGVDRANLGPQGAYKVYEMGTATIMPNCYVELNCYHFRAYLNGAYEEGSFNKVKIYASLKFEGPAFYPADTRPNRVLCDRVIAVKMRP